MSAPSEKKLKLMDLPGNVIGTIAEKTGDWETVMNMAKVDATLQKAIVDQQWKCTKCSDLINLDTEETFSCGVCGNVYCGQPGYEKRFCTPSRACSGCGKIECHSCMCKHLEDCAMCGRGSRSYCAECQGKCDKSCDLCGFPICDHHGNECASCGMKTCGIHDCGPRECGGCKKSYCERCMDFSCCPNEDCMSSCWGYCAKSGSNCYNKLIHSCTKCKEGMGCDKCLPVGYLKEALVCEECFEYEDELEDNDLESDEEDGEDDEDDEDDDDLESDEEDGEDDDDNNNDDGKEVEDGKE
jgi:hypothetical protein